MPDFFSYPITTSPLALVIVFLVALVLSHLILLPLLGDREVRWQYIDYVWLPLAFIGLVGTTQMNRSEMASTYLSVWQSRAENLLALSRSTVANYGRDDSYVCSKGKRSLYSPPAEIFDAIERDHASTCEWFRSVKPLLPHTIAEVPQGYSFSYLPPPPKLTSPAAKGPAEAIEHLKALIKQYLEASSHIAMHSAEKETPIFLIVARYLGPFVLAIALAIRITKVTGEIRIKRKKVIQ